MDQLTDGAGASAPAPLTAAEIADHLAWVEGRLVEMRAADGWADSIVKYQACADELRGLLSTLDNVGQLTSTDPEPPPGTIVRDIRGRRWHRFDDERRSWIQLDNDDDAESWVRVAGNYGPVTVCPTV